MEEEAAIIQFQLAKKRFIFTAIRRDLGAAGLDVRRADIIFRRISCGDFDWLAIGDPHCSWENVSRKCLSAGEVPLPDSRNEAILLMFNLSW